MSRRADVRTDRGTVVLPPSALRAACDPTGPRAPFSLVEAWVHMFLRPPVSCSVRVLLGCGHVGEPDGGWWAVGQLVVGVDVGGF